MDARNAQFQQQLQEKDDEINRLRRELQRRKVHIVSTCMRQQFQPDLSLCAAVKLADMSIIMNATEHCVNGGYERRRPLPDEYMVIMGYNQLP